MVRIVSGGNSVPHTTIDGNHTSPQDSGLPSRHPAQESHSTDAGNKRQDCRQSGRLNPLEFGHIFLAGLYLLCFHAPQLADAHGWLQVPAARNYLANGVKDFWAPMSLNRQGSMSSGGVCGGLYIGDPRFSAGGMHANNQIVGTYEQGAIIDIMIHVEINHWGKFQMRLCPLSDPSAATEMEELNDACLDQHPLELADGSGQWTYPKGPRSAQINFNLAYKLPAAVTCKRCVLQWRWVTGHTCMVPGMDWSYAVKNIMPIPHMCPADFMDPLALPPEKFWNCADIAITGSGGSSSRSNLKVYNGGKMKVTPKSSKCRDRAPGGRFTCAQQKRFGKCNAKWMAGFCKVSCGTCPHTNTRARRLIVNKFA